ncbi:hypothetical protein ABHJ46_003271 [Shigella dysenteriae]|uniref:ead/Ea22-like family protein n=1 Tax=Escherichia coli TaxID=562 RepID=UPI00322138C0
MNDITALTQSHELLIANGTETANLLRHLADNEIDSDYFAVVSECESYGKETEAELSITEFALRAARYVDALVEALEKAQQSVELVDLQRDKIKRLESDLWDKEQLRKVHSEKSFELEGKVRELEARNQKDFVWRGKEISRLNDEVDELKERLESRTVTVKLPDPLMPAQHNSGELFMTPDNVIHGGYLNRDDVLRILAAAGIQVIEGEGQ